MKYVITYGCGCGDEKMVINAKNLDEATSYAYNQAIENYETYEGYHGIPDIEEVCEDQGIEDTASEEAEIAYREERESWLQYSVEEFDENDEEHLDLAEVEVRDI